MYTQCPECTVAFRVTADVLRQAAGKVRCGGCGVAFNALAYLSEEKPQTGGSAASESRLPELKPERRAADGSTSRRRAISAEQSAALLKTLDDLAGEDIQIEDTGIEWRVLNVDDIDDDDDDAEVSGQGHGAFTDTGTLNFVLQDDQSADDMPQVFDARGMDDAAENEAAAASDEMRFDDNTTLPDDFDLESQSALSQRLETLASEAPEELPHPADFDVDVDLALGDPDDWEDLLDEVDDPAAIDAATDLVEVQPAAEVPVFAPDDEAAPVTPGEPGEALPPDMDTQFALQAEAMGIDLSGIHEVAHEAGNEPVGAAAESDDDTSIDGDLLAAAFETEAATRMEKSAAEDLLHEESADDAEAADLERSILAGAGTDAEYESALDEEDAAGFERDVPADTGPESDIEPALDDREAHAEESGDMAATEDFAAGASETAAAEPTLEAAEYDIPPMSEEEMTINRMIDQDLLAIAMEDEDGFTSTIVRKQPPSTGDGIADWLSVQQKRWPEDHNPLVETIVMEGDSFFGELDAENRTAAAEVIPWAGREAARRAQEVSEEPKSRRGWLLVGIILLSLSLAAQLVHQSREALATMPVIGPAIVPVYRSIGRPVAPAWDVRGWRFEATKGSTDAGDGLLTIYSRVGNASDTALPHPLVHVALTDRFEEIIGSRVLEPAQYLVNGASQQGLVAPGATFNAVIIVATPAPDATGFKLNVCYRMAGKQLRCAIEDFK